jgi:hypothetical protein
MIGAMSASSGVEIIFEIAVATGDLLDGIERGLREWCPPEVGVQHHAGGIEYRPERSGGPPGNAIGNILAPCWWWTGPKAARRFQRFSYGGNHKVPGVPAKQGHYL